MSAKIGVMRSFGQAVGIVVNAIRTPVQGDKVVEVSRTCTSERRDDVTLRRTVIDEIIWKESAQQGAGSSDSHSSQTA
jgi:hypothetical protein